MGSIETSRKYRKTVKYKINQSNYWYKTKYGITAEEFDNKILEQNNCCPIGPHPFGPKGMGGNAPVLDHNHAANKNRGVLCRMHNQALGLCHDNTDELKNLIKYLEKWRRINGESECKDSSKADLHL